ncbi:cysteine hydrolase family protein [Mycoplasmopsis cricetuli]|uniref:cysteine hydrolase family protein n=1 Tax=Mycoplasmopsis cricetuli TaxID=171283 RepID=UPI000471018F|nr:isochorismatase family cysteine hydrolase [Mycoplasmopsis cricetuli]
MKNKLTFVIDMINGFTKEGPLASKTIQKIIAPMQKYLKNQKNIIFICDAHSSNDLEMKQYPLHCQSGSFEAKIVDELNEFVTKTNVFYKNTTNAFWELFQSDIWLKYDSFELLGCCTDICILEFALTLKSYFNKIQLDKPIIVHSKLTATFNNKKHNSEQFHNFALQLMKQAGIEII